MILIHMEFRLYNRTSETGITTTRINCSIFDLIGNSEPDQTKGLGYVLSESPIAMKLFLGLLGVKEDLRPLLKQRWVVDCELIQCTDGHKSLRADIIIRFYDGFTPSKAIVIEAKSANASISNKKATSQVQNYNTSFIQLKQQYNQTNIILVTLTTVVEYNNDRVISVTWQDVRDAFSSNIVKKARDHEYHQYKIITDYINYINNLHNAMNYYDNEILSIPAGDSLAAVKDSFIYECPDSGNYKSRGEKHPLYVAFRAGKQNGRIDMLYKIQDIIRMDLENEDVVRSIAATGKYPNFQERVKECISKNGKYKPGMKWVFVLDKESSIELPFPVEYEDSIRGMAGPTYLTLSEVIRKPNNGDKVVKIKMKKDK